MRIIAGSLGGRELRAPRGDRTRPTSDKVRQATFNILGNILGNLGSIGDAFSGAVLDLYAGSGALGIEALSRGADRAVFVDKAPEAVRTIAANLSDLDIADRGEVVRGDVVKVLSNPARLAGPFSLVFFDPPYRFFSETGEAERALALLPPLIVPVPGSRPGPGLGPGRGAILVVEHDRRSPPRSIIGPLSLIDRRRYGDTEVSFYQ